MFLPIGDEPNAKSTPYATYGLIAANLYVWMAVCVPAMSVPVNPLDPTVLDYLATMRRATSMPTSILLQETSAYELMTYAYGFRPAHPSFVALFTSLFLHGSWMHVLGNMLFLWIFGDNIEAKLGAKKYLGLYVTSGIVATLFYAALRAASPMPLIGASGAISGILGAYFIWYGHNRVRVLMVLVIFFQIIYVPARWVLGFYLIVENLLPFLLQTSATSPTAYGAHIGGFFAGGLFALAQRNFDATGSWGNTQAWLSGLAEVLRKPNPGTAQDDPDGAAAAQNAAPRGTASGVAQALAAGDVRAALAEYMALGEPERRILAPGPCFALADSLTQQGNFGLAAQMLQRFITDHTPGAAQDLARAHLRLGLLQLRGLSRPFAAKEHLVTVIDLMPESDEAQAARDTLRSMD